MTSTSGTNGWIRSDVENVVEERQKYGRTVSEVLQDQDQEAAARRKPVLIRSKTFDHSLLTQVQTDSDSKIERKKSHYSQLSKSNSQYHKIFKEISKEEQLRQSYTCALQKDILYQGRMFVSDHWICFHSKVFGKDTKVPKTQGSFIITADRRSGLNDGNLKSFGDDSFDVLANVSCLGVGLRQRLHSVPLLC